MAIKAVLFDFGGTLYDYSCLAAAEAESLAELAQWSGVTAAPVDVARAYRESMKAVFREYLPRTYYRHHDLFRDAAAGMLQRLGVTPDDSVLSRYREAQWQRHRRDFRLREGVVATLEELRRRGVHVGMVSNIDDDQLAHLLDAGGLRPYFDALLSSEAAQSCKPDRKIYEIALSSAGCAPEEALFVGDTLRQDIAGANRMGMRSALIWHRTDKQPPAEEAVPHHVIASIPEIVPLLSR